MSLLTTGRTVCKDSTFCKQELKNTYACCTITTLKGWVEGGTYDGNTDSQANYATRAKAINMPASIDK